MERPEIQNNSGGSGAPKRPLEDVLDKNIPNLDELQNDEYFGKDLEEQNTVVE